MRRSLVVPGLALVLLCPSAIATPKTAPSPALDLDAYASQAVKDWETPGLALAVVRDGKVLLEHGYGLRRLGGEAVDEHTLFAIGSTTKAMTAALIGMLVDEGKLDWDDPVTRHLPSFAVDDAYLTHEITVRDLLTHRAGLGNTDYLWYEQPTTAAAVVSSLRFARPAYSLRSRFLYQNCMYAAAGEVIAAVSGRSWADTLRERLFKPLGMTETVALLADAAGRPNVARPHFRVEGRVEEIENASVDGAAPAGSVWSSAHDMARWLRFLLAGGVTEDGRRLLSETTMRELFTPQAIVGPDSFYPTARLTRPHWTTYGLGWFQADYRGHATNFHTGSIDGMVAIVGLLRDQGAGLVVLGNLDHAELRHALMYRFFDSVIGGQPRDWSRELKALYAELNAAGEKAEAAAIERRVQGTSPSLPLERYAGSYSDPLHGKLLVEHREGALGLHYGEMAGALQPWNYDTFRLDWSARWRGWGLVTFELDETGAVAGLRMGEQSWRRESEAK